MTWWLLFQAHISVFGVIHGLCMLRLLLRRGRSPRAMSSAKVLASRQEHLDGDPLRIPPCYRRQIKQMYVIGADAFGFCERQLNLIVKNLFQIF